MRKPFPSEKGVKAAAMFNSERFILSESKIAIVGLGLMGGSLALALKGKCAALYGIDSNLETVELARTQAFVDNASCNPAELLPEADIVVLATPVPAILELLGQLPGFTPNPCIVFDLGSTKRSVVEACRTCRTVSTRSADILFAARKNYPSPMPSGPSTMRAISAGTTGKDNPPGILRHPPNHRSHRCKRNPAGRHGT